MKVLVQVRRLTFFVGLVILAGMLAGASAAQAALTFDPPVASGVTNSHPAYNYLIPHYAAK